MILIEKTEVVGFEPAIRGMRNPEYEKQHSLVRFPSDSLTEEELLALNGPVICKKG